MQDFERYAHARAINPRIVKLVLARLDQQDLKFGISSRQATRNGTAGRTTSAYNHVEGIGDAHDVCFESRIAKR